MIKSILKATALALPLAFGTAIADVESNSLDMLSGAAPMSEGELANVTGSSPWGRWGGREICRYCANVANVGQANYSGLSALVAQGNSSGVIQSNN